MNEKEAGSEEDLSPMKPYASDLSDAQWAILEPLIPPAKPGGRTQKREYAADPQWDLLCAAQRLRLAVLAT
jgi:transposase